GGAPPAASTVKDPALEALDGALEFLAAHREDQPKAVIERFRSVAARFGGAEAALGAAARREQFEKDVEEDTERRATALASDVERYLASDEIGNAPPPTGR